MIEDKIKEVLDTIRPFLINDGGDIELVKYEDNIVYVKMLGMCAECGVIDYTLTDVIESALQEEIPEIKGVINVTEP